MNRAARVITNLQRFGYTGRVSPINPRYTEIHGLPRYPDLAATPEAAVALDWLVEFSSVQ